MRRWKKWQGTVNDITASEYYQDLIFTKEREALDELAIKLTEIEEAKEEGKLKNQKEVAINLNNANVDIEVIKIATGLSEEEINNIIKNV